MINITFNNQPSEIPNNSSLASVIEQQQKLPQLFSVAINSTFIPREKYAETILQAGDRIDIITPMVGG